MPWLWILIFIFGTYLLVKIVQGVRDFAVWIIENRDLAKLQQASRELHRQGHFGKPPPMKERASRTTPATKLPAGGEHDKPGNSSRKMVK